MNQQLPVVEVSDEERMFLVEVSEKEQMFHALLKLLREKSKTGFGGGREVSVVVEDLPRVVVHRAMQQFNEGVPRVLCRPDGPMGYVSTDIPQVILGVDSQGRDVVMFFSSPISVISSPPYRWDLG